MGSEPTGDGRIPRTDLWRIAWNVLTSDALLAGALLMLAAMLMLRACLPQAPDSATAPVAFSLWVATTQTHLGNLFVPLRQLGLFNLEHSPATRVLIALAALCMMVRGFETISAIWHAWRSQSSPASDGVRLGRFPLASAGRLAVYLGALLIAASLAISDMTGWRARNLTLGVGQIAPVGHGTPYSLRLDALAGQVGYVALLQETDLISQGVVAIGHPMRAVGLAVFLVGTGPAVRASAVLTDGQPVRLQTSTSSAPLSELVLLLTRDESERYLAVPEAGLVIRLSSGAASTLPVRAQVYRSSTGAVIFEDEIPSNGQINVGDVVLTLNVESFAVLDVIRDHGTPLALAGIFVLMLGLAVVSLNLRTYQDWMLKLATPGGLAILSVLICLIAARNLMYSGELWPISPVPIALLAIWLAGCAIATLPYRAARWAILMLAAVALALVLTRPAAILAPNL